MANPGGGEPPRRCDIRRALTHSPSHLFASMPRLRYTNRSMAVLIELLATYAPYIYAACGLVALYQLYRLS